MKAYVDLFSYYWVKYGPVDVWQWWWEEIFHVDFDVDVEAFYFIPKLYSF